MVSYLSSLSLDAYYHDGLYLPTVNQDRPLLPLIAFCQMFSPSLRKKLIRKKGSNQWSHCHDKSDYIGLWNCFVQDVEEFEDAY